MTRSLRNAAFLAAVFAGASLAGCGSQSSSCPTTTADLTNVSSLSCSGSVQPGGTVKVQVGVCQACNQTSPTCTVDQQGFHVALDAQVEECDSASSCNTPTNCAPFVFCQFSPPSPGDYLIYDANGTQLLSVTAADGGSASVTCN